MSRSDFSSQSLNPVERLKRAPLQRVDSSAKCKEKDDMVGLNDKFVQLIDKVKSLEDENRKLETKLKILKGQVDYDANIEDLVREKELNLRKIILTMREEQEKLKIELKNIQQEVDNTRNSYEEELNTRIEAEQEFVIAKRDIDEENLQLVDISLEWEELYQELEFLREGFNEEIKELNSMILNETVVLPNSTQRSLDMEEVVKTFEVQYATMATRARDEAELWNQKKMDAMVQSAGQKEQEVKDQRREINDILRQIQRLTAELEALQRKEENYLKEIEDIRKNGEDEAEKYQKNIRLIEEALNEAKQTMAQLIREHQELLNLKLALDVEILTYRKLLEGEEERMKDFSYHSDVHLPEKHLAAAEPTVQPTVTKVPDFLLTPESITSPQPAAASPLSEEPKERLLIRLKVVDGKLVSEVSECF